MNSITDKSGEDILLPNNQVPSGAEIGDGIEVFVYKDSEDKTISTLIKPKLTAGDISVLQAVTVTKIGAFLDWGLEKDLFLPFREQVGKVEKGGTYDVVRK